MTNWQPIETAPKDGTTVDVWAVWPYDDHKGQRFTDVYIEDEPFEVVGAFDDRAFDEDWTFTHWQPLPEPPKEAK